MSQRRAGFTLLEMLVAVALLAILFVALNTFVFSMGAIWGQGAEQRLFDQHVRAVTRHVEKLFRSAALSSLGDPAHALGVGEIRSPAGAQTLLSFELPAGDRLLKWPEHPLPDVVCAVGVAPGEGLVLYWHSRLEKNFATEAPRTRVISPFATALGYDYYQPEFKTWRREPGLVKDQNGKWRLPDRITLQFVHGKLSAQTTITLSAPVGGLPAF